jgi:hypothetical protein
MTPAINKIVNISANFHKIAVAPMGYSGAQGKLIHEKKLYLENLVSD